MGCAVEPSVEAAAQTRLVYLEINNLRCIDRMAFEPHDEVNVIVGENGAGKTSVLEAVHILATGRSHRCRSLSEVRRQGGGRLAVRARIESGGSTSVIEVEQQGSKTQISVGRQLVRAASALVNHLPVVVFDVASGDLVEGGPKLRRRWLDRTLLHTHPGFLDVWMAYHRALRQRNAGLGFKQNSSAAGAFDDLLIQAAERLSRLRWEAFNGLNKEVSQFAERHLGLKLDMTFQPGHPETDEPGLWLKERRAIDLSMGCTQQGPHRADLDVRLEAGAARRFASRGQAKRIALAMVMGQVAYIRSQSRKTPLLLVDDLPAELDAESQGMALGALRGLGAQIFLTTTEAGRIQPSADFKRFHVKRGALVESDTIVQRTSN